MSGLTCVQCGEHFDPNKGRHFCPRCAKCNAVIEADTQHTCSTEGVKGFFPGDGYISPPAPQLNKVNKTKLRKPLAEGGILGMKIKIGPLHFVIRGGTGGQIVLHPLGIEPGSEA